MQLVCARTEGALEHASVGLGLDLLRVGGAHRAERVGEGQASLHEVHLVVELEPALGEHVPGQTEVRHHLLGEEPLVGEVVNREQAARLAERGAAESARKRQRREPRLPVVEMHDVRGELHRLRSGQRSHGEEGEPPVVVAVLATRVTVDPRAAVEARVVEEPDLVPGRRPRHADHRTVLAERESQPDRAAGVLRVRGPGRGVERRDHPDLVTSRRECPRERVRHVTQSARFAVGRDLGGDVENLHRPTMPTAGRPSTPECTAPLLWRGS